MKIHTRTLATLERGYSIALLPAVAGRRERSFLAGSEDEDRLLFFEAPDYRPKVIARSPGGYISTAALVRGSQRQVIATTEFKPGFNAAPAALRVYPLDGPEEPPSVGITDLPYTHRIAVQAWRGREYLLASTLCAAKADKDDWTQPGGIHVAEIPGDVAQSWRFRQVVTGLNKNHGMDFARLGRERRPGYLLSAMEGLFFMPLPEDPAGAWPTERISAEETSDAFAFDWDGDGEPEIFSISPFHGHVLSVHRRGAAGWTRQLIHDDLAFGHIVWAGDFLGGPGLLAGSRRERRELRLYRPDGRGGIDPNYTLIDEGIGPSQLQVVAHDARAATLYVAAHGRNEVRLYELEA